MKTHKLIKAFTAGLLFLGIATLITIFVGWGFYLLGYLWVRMVLAVIFVVGMANYNEVLKDTGLDKWMQ
jgi:xanthine/uracil permease